ncbi:DUF3726 domain-containing protein [Paracoccus pacificus]|uniref:DUF3726 domain-containing protein n=1 Tax=Paracoccus pacificus TaxID=1463598 RepID=A0ABW4R7G8_9RHOB
MIHDIAQASDPTPSGTPMPAAGTDFITLSRGEVEALCAKAARGAGMSWGMADEAGFAAAWLAARGFDAAAVLLAHLEATQGKPWSRICPVVRPGAWRAANGDPLCPIALGATLCDFAADAATDTDADAEGLCPSRSLTAGPVSRPLLVLPFLADIARRLNRRIRLGWSGAAVHIGPGGALAGDLSGLALLPRATVLLVVSPQDDPGHGAAAPLPATPEARPKTSRETMARLNALAMKTTVPPSDNSRADAGAGTTDND